jgi:pimeloyl-ACP methyl ester carboxylesterase
LLASSFALVYDRRMTRPAATGSVRSVVFAVVALFLLDGCSTILAVREQQERADANAVVSGTVSTEQPARGPLFVGILGRDASGFYLVDHFVAEKPGPWIFVLAAGTYWLAACEDVNGDGRYEDEPALAPELDKPLHLAPGQGIAAVKLVIPAQGRFTGSFTVADLQSRDPAEQQRVSAFKLSVAGEVASLDDPRFAPEVGVKGMWQYYDFLLETHPGIYFLQPYDAKKIPVLFVHGITGTPRDFRSLIAALDRDRFQPWVYYYASGAGLDSIAELLRQLFVRLRVQYRFKEAAVVAHSMGGLVTREFLLKDNEESGTEVVRTYVTISSPLGGMKSAGSGVETSPIVVRSWYGLAPHSPFLDGLYYKNADKTERRRLPESMAYHMLFGYRGKGSTDNVVTINSQLRYEAQEESSSLRGFHETHTSILESPAVAARLNEILAAQRSTNTVTKILTLGLAGNQKPVAK